jgi:hypothetical protein
MGNDYLVDEYVGLKDEVEVMKNLLVVYVHAHRTGNSVPPQIEAEAIAALSAGGNAENAVIDEMGDLRARVRSLEDANRTLFTMGMEETRRLFQMRDALEAAPRPTHADNPEYHDWFGGIRAEALRGG